MSNHEKIFLIDGNSFDKDGLLSFCYGNIASPGTPGREREIWEFLLEWLSPDDHIEVQTSGSTGKPKKIRLQKKHMEASARLTLDFFNLKPHDTALLCLPVKYIAGKMMIVRALTGGLNLLLAPPSGVPDLGRFEKIAFSAMVPMQVSELLAKPDGRIQLEKIETLIIGGSFLDQSLEKKLKTMENSIWQTYGMTETISHIALRKLNGPEASVWYSPLQGVELKKDDRGCLAITAPHIGVQDLVTNDLVEFNEDGSFKILGRTDNVVISGGVKIFPEEIEKKAEALIPYPFFFSGLPDEKLGEKLILFICRDILTQSEKQNLKTSLSGILARYEMPKEIINLQTFEYNRQGKLLRKQTVDNFLNKSD
ncbi:MAG: AMP-binding protein [Chlorobi bacterium]|nr:AMP-binding protein [Chlorobiota bacterium]